MSTEHQPGNNLTRIPPSAEVLEEELSRIHWADGDTNGIGEPIYADYIVDVRSYPALTGNKFRTVQDIENERMAAEVFVQPSFDDVLQEMSEPLTIYNVAEETIEEIEAARDEPHPSRQTPIIEVHEVVEETAEEIEADRDGNGPKSGKHQVIEVREVLLADFLPELAANPMLLTNRQSSGNVLDLLRSAKEGAKIAGRNWMRVKAAIEALDDRSELDKEEEPDCGIVEHIYYDGESPYSPELTAAAKRALVTQAVSAIPELPSPPHQREKEAAILEQAELAVRDLGPRPRVDLKLEGDEVPHLLSHQAAIDFLKQIDPENRLVHIRNGVAPGLLQEEMEVRVAATKLWCQEMPNLERLHKQLAGAFAQAHPGRYDPDNMEPLIRLYAAERDLYRAGSTTAETRAYYKRKTSTGMDPFLLDKYVSKAVSDYVVEQEGPRAQTRRAIATAKQEGK